MTDPFMVQQPVVELTGLYLQLVEVLEPSSASQFAGVIDDGLDAQGLEVLLDPAVPVESV